MAQQMFSGAGPGDPADLDANFTELYSKAAWASTGIGYATGAGGTVTQLTSKSTTVTLNKVCGQIVMHAASMAGGDRVIFQLANSALALGDVLILNVVSAASGIYNYTAAGGVYADGNAQIIVTNITSGSLAESVTLAYAVVRAVGA